MKNFIAGNLQPIIFRLSKQKFNYILNEMASLQQAYGILKERGITSRKKSENFLDLDQISKSEIKTLESVLKK